MMSMKFEKWWWPVQCYTLSNGLNFAGLVRLGYLYSVSVWCLWKYFGEWEILQQQSQQFLITSFIREIMEAVYFIFCCFRRLSYVLLDFLSFLFFSFRAILNYLNRGRLIKNWKKKKRNHLFRDISFTLFFFSYYRVFLSCRVLVIHDRTVKDPR